MVAPGKTIRWLILGLAAVALVACGGDVATSTASATRLPTITPIPPTPTLAASTTSLNATSGQLVGLLRNRSNQSIASVELELLDRTRDQVIGRAGPLLPWLGPGGESPFQFPMPAAIPIQDLQVVVDRYEFSTIAPTAVQFDWDVHESNSAGGERWTGWIESQGGLANIDGIAIGASGANGWILASIAATPTWLRSDQSAPIEIAFASPVDPSSLETYVSATASTEIPAEVTVELEPGWSVDSQGGPFVVGTLENKGGTAASVRMLMGLRSRGRLRRTQLLESSIPLLAGEQRPFVVRFDRAIADEEAPAVLDPYLEAFPTDSGAVVNLEVGISATELPGSAFLLIGSVANPTDQTVENPTILAALRATDGSPWSAGWQTITDSLGAGDSVSFVLEMPLPVGIDPRLGEWDVRALGQAAP